MRQPQPPGVLLPLRRTDAKQLQGLTPGQQAKHSMALKAMYNPYSQNNRTVLNDNFGIQLPLIPQVKEKRVRNYFHQVLFPIPSKLCAPTICFLSYQVCIL